MAVPPPEPIGADVIEAALAKRKLRTELRAARAAFVDAMTPARRAALEARAAEHLVPLLSAAPSVAFYLATGSEIGCRAAIDAVMMAGVTVALPRVEGPELAMRMICWTPGDQLERGWRGLLQPSPTGREITPDAIVAPLLGFDADGWRLGQGAGFYDRLFAACPHAARIGLGWSIQQRDAIAHDSWDVALAAIVTEQGVIEGARR